MTPGTDAPGGVRGLAAVPADTLLAERARDYLRGGPADVVPLVEHVCQLPGPPRVVAEHLAQTLLASLPEFARGADGLWRLADRPAAPEELGGPAARRIAANRGPLLTSLSYVVVDVETTGGRAAGGDRITEIACVVVRDGAVVHTYETLVNPERPIPRWITQLTNISWDMVKDKPTFREVCDEVLRTLEGHVFVAHNATFDWKFVCAEVARATGQLLQGQRLCTVRMARKLLPQLPRRNLDHVAMHYGVDISARHRAAGDAVATAHCLLGLLRDAGQRGIECWDDLDRLLSARTSAKRRRRRRPAMPTAVGRDTSA